AGARVFATAGAAAKLELCRALGAELAINYKTEAFAERVAEASGGQGANLVLDFVGAPYWEANMAALAPYGRLMLIGFLGGSRGALDIGAILGKSLTVAGTTLRRTPLDQKVALTRAFAEFALPRFASGELRPVIDRTFDLADAADAHRYVESNASAGKVVLKVGV
ncbi:MAG TPA: zinc-binding dehydrogenase, partial [Kouleothrix sp.]|nr:zinc-binding dehydrogenase [Kouleothrix sp.]